MPRHKDYLVENGITAPDELRNSINLVCSTFAKKGIHGTLYFMDHKLVNKQILQLSSWNWEIVLDGSEKSIPNKIIKAINLLRGVFEIWNNEPYKYCQCFPHFRYYPSNVTMYVPKIIF